MRRPVDEGEGRRVDPHSRRSGLLKTSSRLLHSTAITSLTNRALARGLLPEVNEGGCAQILIRRRARREHEQVVAAADRRPMHPPSRAQRARYVAAQSRIDRFCSQARAGNLLGMSGPDRSPHCTENTHDSVPQVSLPDDESTVLRSGIPLPWCPTWPEVLSVGPRRRCSEGFIVRDASAARAASSACRGRVTSTEELADLRVARMAWCSLTHTQWLERTGARITSRQAEIVQWVCRTTRRASYDDNLFD
jgi:hypothetical protein